MASADLAAQMPLGPAAVGCGLLRLAGGRQHIFAPIVAGGGLIPGRRECRGDQLTPNLAILQDEGAAASQACAGHRGLARAAARALNVTADAAEHLGAAAHGAAV